MKIVRVVGGKRHEIEVPQGVARELGISQPGAGPVTVPYLMEGLFVWNPSGGSASEQCHQCGTTVREVILRNRVGCPACYDSHGATIERLLKVQKEPVSGHRGRIPERLQRYRRLLVDRSELLSRLSTAVAAEEFEKAATLRDELHRLDSEESLSG